MLSRSSRCCSPPSPRPCPPAPRAGRISPSETLTKLWPPSYEDRPYESRAALPARPRRRSRHWSRRPSHPPRCHRRWSTPTSIPRPPTPPRGRAATGHPAPAPQPKSPYVPGVPMPGLLMSHFPRQCLTELPLPSWAGLHCFGRAKDHQNCFSDFKKFCVILKPCCVIFCKSKDDRKD